MDRQPHVVVVPYPAQGHVKPLVKLSHQIADYGVKVTFVNTEFLHAKVMASMPDKDKEKGRIELVLIPDGLEPEDDRKDGIKLIESVKRVMPGHLKDLILKMNNSDSITCIIADATIGEILEVAEEIKYKYALIWPAGAGNMALLLHIPKLIEAGIIDMNGKNNMNFVYSFMFSCLRGFFFPWVNINDLP